ncbi:MAG TPA: carboxypeptidase-like regulatory domain-containing protein, partial [Vicinamibacterales bacterium]|nr:carboxypeptidase-like regulatory domain-containing protein [Vicinamibacterales bacterium]
TVRDTHGHIVTTTINLVVLDAVGPVVAITGTKSGARVAPGEQAQVIVHATDAGAVRSVSLQASGAALLNETRVIDPALNDVATAFTIVVPPTAQPGQTITLQSTAVDAAGNIGIAPALALSVADRNPPTLTLMTSTGRNEIVPGTPVRIIAAAEDEVGVARIAIQGDGAMAFADARSFSPALGSASTEFIVNVPAAIAEGAVLSITAHAVDLFGNASDPVTLLLEARTLAAVTAPSTIVIAGETVNVPVTLGSPAPAGGLVLTFTSRAPAVVTSDGNIAIPAGATEGVVRVSGLTGGVTQIDISTAGVPRGSFTTTVRGGVVRGLVTGPNGAVAGAAVSVQVGIDLISTVTDSNGQYFVEGLVRGQVADVSAADPGGELIGFSRGLMNAVGGFANVNVVLAAGARVAGQVTRADGSPVGEGVRVEIFDDRLQSAGIVFTDEDSRYAFPFLELGAYHVDASDTNGNRGRVPVTLTFSGQAITADIRYLGRGTVTGTVRAGGNPVANAEVVLRASSIFGPAAEVVTNAGPDGVYVVDDVFVGTFTVQAIDPVSDRAGFATGSLLVDGELVTRDVAVQAYGTLAGRVLRGDGITPVPGARVILTGSAQTETVADVDGAFQFQFLPLGSYTITAHDVATEQPHFNPAVRLASTVMGRNTATLNVSGATVTRDVQLLPIGSIVATVLDDGGQPVADAKVFVTTRNGALEQTRSGSTDQSGIAVIGSVITGAYSARANTLLLASDPVTGTIAADEIEQVTLTLAPTGSIAGVLTEPDGFTPAAGSVVLDPAVIPNARMTVNADGSWRFDGIRFYSRYTIHAYDAAGRRRGVAREIDINVANEVEQRNISLIGIGAIAGRVVNPDGSGVPNVAVVVQSFTSEFGGAQQTFTDAAGFYSLPDVVAGAFRVSVEDTTRQLAAEAFGEIPALGGNVALDLALVPNSLQLPTFLYDANGRFYQIPQSGGDPQSGGFSLDVTLDGTTTPFSGAAFGTREDAGREIATREVMGPLQITRKVYVPQGYFARHLEQFTNLGAAPVAVTVALTNRVTQFIGGAGARLTSSGDEQFAAGPERDRWIIVRQGPDANLVTGVDGT